MKIFRLIANHYRFLLTTSRKKKATEVFKNTNCLWLKNVIAWIVTTIECI